jgi:hypothetical protein
MAGSVVTVTADPYAEAWQRVADAILTTPGVLSADERRAIAGGDGPRSALIEKVRVHAYKVVAADLAGLTDDAAIETILAAALGAADERRRAALKAIG